MNILIVSNMKKLTALANTDFCVILKTEYVIQSASICMG